MEPSPEARQWGKRQAARSPRWSDAKWTRIATLVGVTLAPTTDKTSTDQTKTADTTPTTGTEQVGQPTEIMRDAA